MLFDYFQQNFQIFLTIFVRVFGLILIMPILSPNVPAMGRAGLSFFMALLASPMIINEGSITTPDNLMDLGLVILSNFLIGLSIGFVIQITLSAVQLSSSVFSTTMGLSLSESMDPLSNTSVPALGNLLSIIIMLLFIRTESHITFIELVIRSFIDFPIIQQQSTTGLFIAIKSSSSMIFSLALQLSMPIIAITLLLDLAMGLIGRVAPQFNVMLMGWNIKLLMGFLVLWFVLPGIMDFGTLLFKELHDMIITFIRIAKGE